MGGREEQESLLPSLEDSVSVETFLKMPGVRTWAECSPQSRAHLIPMGVIVTLTLQMRRLRHTVLAEASPQMHGGIGRAGVPGSPGPPRITQHSTLCPAARTDVGTAATEGFVLVLLFLPFRVLGSALRVGCGGPASAPGAPQLTPGSQEDPACSDARSSRQASLFLFPCRHVARGRFWPPVSLLG